MLFEALASGGGSDWYNVILLTTAPGAAITITDGDEEIEATGTGSQQAIAIHDESATYTISVAVNGFTKSGTSITTGTTSGVIFEREVAFAEVTLTYDDDFRGETGTISDGTTTANYTFPASDNETTIYIPSTGTWNVYCTISGEQYKSSDIVVTSLSDSYASDIHVRPNGKTVMPTDDIQTWLECAGIKGKFYTTLDEVLADHETLQKLISDENAVDYMVRSKSWIKKEALIPAATGSDPTHIKSSSDYDATNYQNWRAFDGDPNTRWNSSNSSSTEWLEYDFDTPFCVTRIYIDPFYYDQNGRLYFKHGYLQAFDDTLNDWISLKEISVENTPGGRYFDIDNNIKYNKYRLYCDQTYSLDGVGISFWEIQLYGPEGITDSELAMRYIGKRNYAADTLLADEEWRNGIYSSTYVSNIINVEVPTMSGATTPSGEAFGDFRSGYEPWKAFDKSNSTLWSTNDGETLPCYIGYKFDNPVKISKVTMIGRNESSGNQDCSIVFQASNTGNDNDYVDLATLSYVGSLHATNQIFYVGNNYTNGYLYYRLKFADRYNVPFDSGYCQAVELNFYGREDVDESMIDVYSAAIDNFYEKDSLGNIQIIDATGSDGHAQVSRTDLPNGIHTLYSSVAKNPNDLEAATPSDYFKTVKVDDSTIEIMLMPDDALYWYGNVQNFEEGSTANGWVKDSSSSFVNSTWDTYKITEPASNCGQLGNKHPIDNVERYNTVFKTLAYGSGAPNFAAVPTKATSMVSTDQVLFSVVNDLTRYSNNKQKYPYIKFFASSGNYGEVHAVWADKENKTPTYLSAAYDTLYILDGNRQIPIATTNGEGKSFDALLEPGTYDIYSSVAKDPTNLSNPYHKQVTITAATQTVKVMPENTLYWYGYKGDNLEDCTTANGWTNNEGIGFTNPTYNDRNITISSASNTYGGVGSKNICSISNSIKCIAKGITSVANACLYISHNSTKLINADTVISTTEAVYTQNVSGNNYASIVNASGRSGTLYALWYE